MKGRWLFTEKQCIICGKQFVAKNKNNITCSIECSKINKNIVNRKRRHEKKSKRTYTYALSAIEAKARLAGMTYGKYVDKNHI